MEEFLYEGVDKEGNELKDTIEAKNERQAFILLRRRKIKISKIKPDAKPLFASKKVKGAELMQVTKKMSSMVKAGLPVVETIEILKGQAKSYGMKYVLKTIHRDLNSGVTISDAFAKHPKVFDNIYLNIIAAGEESGMLDDFLEKLAEMMEKRDKIAKGLRKAFTYPTIVIVIALGISIFMLIKVIPIFQEMYGGMGVELPQFTQVLINMSEFLRNPSQGGTMFVSIIAFFVIFNLALKRITAFRRIFHKLCLRLPLFGELIMKSTFSRLSLVMSNLMRAGVPILQVLEIGTNVSTNLPIKDALSRVKGDVLSGKELSALFARDKIFPTELSQLVSVGEKTGNVDEMLNSIATYYEEEFDVSVATLSAAIEPLMIVLVGGIVAGLLLGMYLPIFNAGALFGA